MAVTTSHSLQGDVGSVTGSPERLPQGRGKHQPLAHLETPPPPPALALGEGDGPRGPAPAPAGDHSHETPGAILSLKGSRVPQRPL